MDVSSTDERLVKEILVEKHSPAYPALADFIVDAHPQATHQDILNDLDGDTIGLH